MSYEDQGGKNITKKPLFNHVHDHCITVWGYTADIISIKYTVLNRATRVVHEHFDWRTQDSNVSKISNWNVVDKTRLFPVAFNVGALLYVIHCVHVCL